MNNTVLNSKNNTFLKKQALNKNTLQQMGWKLILVFSLLFFILQLGQAQVALTNQEAAQLKTKVLETAQSIETITSDFVQKKYLDFLSNEIETIGKMAFKSPDLIKWEYTDPFAYSVIFRDKTLYINDGGNKSNIDLGGNKMFESMNDLIAKSIKGDMFDEKEFKIAYFKKDGNYLVKFEPIRKELNTYIKTFELTFDAKNANVLEVKMIEPSDDYTRIIFENRLINVQVADETFENRK